MPPQKQHPLNNQTLCTEDAARTFQDRGLTTDDTTLRLLFPEARTHYGGQDRDAPDETLPAPHEIAGMDPTSMHQQPARVPFIRLGAAKDRLEPFLLVGYGPKMRDASVRAIIACDLSVREARPRLFPRDTDAADVVRGKATAAQIGVFRNGSRQGACFLLALGDGLSVGGWGGTLPEGSKMPLQNITCPIPFVSNGPCGHTEDHERVAPRNARTPAGLGRPICRVPRAPEASRPTISAPVSRSLRCPISKGAGSFIRRCKACQRSWPIPLTPSSFCRPRKH